MECGGSGESSGDCGRGGGFSDRVVACSVFGGDVVIDTCQLEDFLTFSVSKLSECVGVAVVMSISFATGGGFVVTVHRDSNVQLFLPSETQGPCSAAVLSLLFS